MQKKVIVLSLILSIFAACRSCNANPEIVFRAQTPKEAASYCMNLFSKLSWFKQNGYNASLPQHKEFTELYANPEKIVHANIQVLEKVFTTEIYKKSDFDKGLQIVVLSKNIIDEAFKKFTQLHDNWNFNVMPKYEVVLTLYGTGGSYNALTGHIILKTSIDGKLMKNTIRTIIHEMVHIGIEENIVQKYKLTHWEKERLVDLICSIYLKELLPGYEIQETGNKNIDEFLSYENILKNLPAAIENFLKKYPR